MLSMTENLTIARVKKQIAQKWAGVNTACQRQDVALAMALMRDIDWLLDQLSVLLAEEKKKCPAQ